MAKRILEVCFIVSDTKLAREAADRLRAAWISVGGSTFTHDALFKASPLGYWNPAPSGNELRRRIVERNKSSLGFPSLDLHAVFVVGGDGLLLEAVRTCHAEDFDVPFIGWNTGRVGFWMHDPPTGDDALVEQLRAFVGGGHDTIELPLLKVALVHGDHSGTIAHAFNEVTIRRVDQAVRLGLTVDGVSLGTMAGDGLLIASPQGSTAYCVNAGGPAVDPFLPSITIVPLIPSRLSGNSQLLFPIVFAPTRTIVVDVLERGKRPAIVELDNVRFGDVVRVSATFDFRCESTSPVRLLYPIGFGGTRRFPRRVEEKLLHGGHRE